MNEHLESADHPEDSSDEVTRVLRETFSNDIPEGLDRRMTAMLSSFRKDLEHHPYVSRLRAKEARSMPSWPWPSFLNAGKLALLGAVVFLLFVIVESTFVGKGVPTWADIEERFRSVKSYSVVIYAREDTFAPTIQYELWVNSDGRKRLRTGSQVLFATGEEVTRVFDLENRRETKPEVQAVQILRFMAAKGGFSLETLMRAFSGDWVESTPKVNADAVISEDLVVFDVEQPGSPDWLRVWALRGSRLPIQMRGWEPKDGECVDFFFSYSAEQPSEFYDPEAFATKLQDPTQSKWGLAYASLDDPGGRQVQSDSINEECAFSTVTMTLDGKPWSLGEHRGKAILVGFWSTDSGFDYEDWWKETYAEFGDREDFVMVGVALDLEAGPVRDYIRAKGIKWVQLHEPGKGYKNSLSQSFGVTGGSSTWLIWKNGEIEPLGHGGDQVRAALLGLSYETHSDLTWRISHRIGDGKGMTKDEVRNLCGPPDKIEPQVEGETWLYELEKQDHSKTYEVSLTFDGSGKNTNLISQHRILNAAVATISISEDYWARAIGPKLDRGLLLKDHKYGVAMVAKRGNTWAVIGGGHPWTEVEPGKEYLRRLDPGAYDFSIVISDKQTYQNVQEIPLREGVELVAGETLEVRFE
ncbi:MAG: hypothetical protein HUU16_13355 [Candidatus Omnitrophica bacterium]|nr:hypothetical protein [bacterium]NUN97150.1 hypothetical protein [Candidatus Omnitrophota bacterium]